MKRNGALLAAAEAVEDRSDEAGSAAAAAPPDSEVEAKPKRRRFTAAYRLRILEEADRCQNPGEVGRLRRREGLYSSHLSQWRKARREGSLAALAPRDLRSRSGSPRPAAPWACRGQPSTAGRGPRPGSSSPDDVPCPGSVPA